VTPESPDPVPVVLNSGSQLVRNGSTVTSRKLGELESEDVIAWREGRIVFNGVPLRDAVDRFARYQGRQIDVSPEVEALRLGGSFHLDNFDAFLRDVQDAIPVRVLRTDDDRIRLVPR
jgi:transmembrane sensor